jgi:hypothetical protein
MLETAAASGAMDLLQVHTGLAQNPEYMASIGLEHEPAEAVPEHLDKANRLGALSNAMDESGQEVERSLARVFGEQPGRPPAERPREHTRAEYDRIRVQLEKLTKDDGASRKALSELAPTTAGLAQMTILTGAQYLLDKAPQDPTAGLPPALRRPWEPSKTDLRDWFRRVDAVADPRSVLDEMGRGAVSAEALEVMRTVYPQILRDIQDRMMARLAAWDKPMDRKLRGQVEQIVGNLGDPAVTQLIQAAHLRSIPPKQGTPDGREKLDVERNQQTQAQRLEGRQARA